MYLFCFLSRYMHSPNMLLKLLPCFPYCYMHSPNMLLKLFSCFPLCYIAFIQPIIKTFLLICTYIFITSQIQYMEHFCMLPYDHDMKSVLLRIRLIVSKVIMCSFVPRKETKVQIKDVDLEVEYDAGHFCSKILKKN